MMKNLLTILLVVFVGWQSFAQLLNQAANWPNAAWTLTGTYSAPNVLSDPTTSANFSYDDDGAGSGSTDILNAASPIIDLTAAFAGGETWINVDYDYNYNLGVIFNLEWYDFDSGTWQIWEALPDNSSLTSGWCAGIAAPIVTSTTLDISGFTATQLSGFQYRFAYNASTTWGWGFCVSSPTIFSSTPPSCLDPTALASTNTTSTSVDISWTAGGTETLWNIEYGTPGFTPGTASNLGGVTGTSNNPETISGLSANTTYEIYVQADCGGNGTSNWVGPLSVYTGHCIPASTNQTSWVSAFNTTGGVSNFSYSAASGTAGGYNDQFGNYTVSNYTGGTTNINMTAGGPTCGFAVWVDWNNNLVFETTERVFNTTGYVTTTNGSFVVPAVANGTYRMRVVTDWNASNPSNPCASITRGEFVDYRFEVVDAPSCVGPTALISTGITSSDAVISWTAGGTETLWNIEFGATGFTPGTGANIGGVTGTGNNPETITGLSANTTYEIYVQADCGGNGTSNWSGPISFTTQCSSISAPWIETFSGTAIPSCWNQSATTGGPWVFGVTTNPDFGNNTEPNDHTSGVPDLYAWVDQSATDVGVILTSPVIDVSALTTPELKFFVYSTNPTGSVTTFNILNVEYYDGTAWQLVSAIQGDFGAQWQQFAYDATPYVYATNLVKFRFRMESGGDVNDFDNDVLLDDVSVDEMPSCPSPIASSSEVTGPSTATIFWDIVDPAPANGYQYYVSTTSGAPAPGTTPTGTTADTTASLTGLTANTTYYYYIASDCGTDVGLWSAGGNFFTGYCTPAPSSVDGNGITNVTFGTINNTTVAEPGNYGDYTTLSNDVAQSTTATVSITFETGFTYDTKIWVDWNDDLDFNDAGEEVYVGVSTANNPTTLIATFPVDVAAPLGQHRMRIGGQDTGPPVPCYNGTWGSYEDYTINIIPAPLCLAPSNVSSYNVTTSSATVSWSEPSPAPSNGYVYYVSTDATQPAVGASPTGTTTDTTVNLTSILADTTYYVWVASDCGTEVGPWSSSTSFFTGYCVPTTTFGCTDGDVIARVVLNTLDNNSGTGCPSGNAGYSDYTGDASLTTTLLPSSTYNCTVFAGQWPEGYAVWIDYNDDLTFDATELVGFSNGLVAGSGAVGVLGDSATFPISLACNPPAGDHRMRVRAMYNVNGVNVTPCDDNSYGEIEDYLITIADAPSCPATGILVAGNPSISTIDLNWQQGCSNATYYDIEYGPAGFTPGTGMMVSGVFPTVDSTGMNYTLSGLDPNTDYDAYVRASCDSIAGDYSAWSIKATETTLCAPIYLDTISSNIMTCGSYDLPPVTEFTPSGNSGLTLGWYTDSTFTTPLANNTVTSSQTVWAYGAAGTCMDSYFVNVTIYPTDSVFIVFDDSLGQFISYTTNASTFAWVECSDTTTVLSTNMNYTPTMDGDYALITYTADGCMAMSECLNYSTGSVIELNGNTITVSPNPTNGWFELNAVNAIHSYFTIVDATGRKVMESFMNGLSIAVDLSKEQPGVYFMNFKDKELGSIRILKN